MSTLPPVQWKEWTHAPPHLFSPNTVYFITASTYGKAHHFLSADRLTFLQSTVFNFAERFEWTLEAWAFLSNHYHLICRAPQDARTLVPMVRAIHSVVAKRINREDDTPGRQVWFQYRDTCLTYQRSYLARLKYVHANPEKHGVVARAENYPWCSMKWFLQEANPGFGRTVLEMKTDKLQVLDDFECQKPE